MTEKKCRECGGRGDYYTEWSDKADAQAEAEGVVVLHRPDPPDGTVNIRCPQCHGTGIEIVQRWRVPFTPSQVAVLNDFQKSGKYHPYMCPRREGNHPPRALVACTDGLYCPDKWCVYLQEWAHVLPITPRHVLIGAQLVTHLETAPDGYQSIVVHTDEHAADRALRALFDAGWMLVKSDPPLNLTPHPESGA